MQLLNRIHQLAKIAEKLRLLVWALGVLSLGFFCYIIFSEAELDTFLLPSVVALGWSICLLGIASNFQEIPQRPDQGKGFFRRIVLRVRYGVAWFWAAFFAVCTLILVYMSLRSIFMFLSA